jgi:predicted outer membrane lipoprotein
VWLASAFSVIPILGFLIMIAGYVYAGYLIYLGSMVVLRVPPTSAGGFTAVVIVIWIGLYLVVSFIIGLILAAAFLTSAVGYGGGYLN